jgi:hypothetical protein
VPDTCERRGRSGANTYERQDTHGEREMDVIEGKLRRHIPQGRGPNEPTKAMQTQREPVSRANRNLGQWLGSAAL